MLRIDVIDGWLISNGLPKLSADQADKFKKYQELLLEAGKKFNLTRIAGDYDIAVKHFVDSLTLLPWVDEAMSDAAERGISFLDLGTGAGFPGIPLKILRSELKLTLLDSLHKRINFLRGVAPELGLVDIECVHARAEELAKLPGRGSSYDICAARAVAKLGPLASAALPLVRRGGLFLAMKGPGAPGELASARSSIKKSRGEVECVREVFISEDAVRFVVAIRKI